MAQPVTPPRIQAAPVEPSAPARPAKKLSPINNMEFNSARILFPEPAAGAPQAVASTIVDIAAKVIKIR